ncbi:MAG: Bax inhibitor-1/YccA family protein [Elusimicrobia bacterium]|nr:Bax inhibitor-1/YccA family protein [Elusimicrobiota bacterium]
MDTYQPTISESVDTGLRHFVHMVYGWMCAGLLVTGACAAYMVQDPQRILNLVHNPFLFYGLMIAELGLVFALSGWVEKMEASTATFAFLFYAALTGVTLSAVFLVYTRSSIANVFFMTAGLFGVLCAYGYATKTDLTSVGNLAGMGLIGLILASLVNMWFKSPMASWVLSIVGVAVFTGLTAYDAQKIKAIYRPEVDGTDVETKEAVLGALILYLDFINLFLELLQLFGRRRD